MQTYVLMGGEWQLLKALLFVSPGWAAAVLALVAPGLQVLRLKEQAVLLYGREALRSCYFALDRKRLVG